MTNTRFDEIGAFRDIESLNHYAEATAAGDDPDAVLAGLRTMSRDNARTPMQWDAGAHAGFTTGEPWIPVNANFAEINAEAAVADPDSVFHHYRRLIELRHTEPVVAHGDFTMLLQDDERVYAFTRRLGDDELLVLGNFSGEDAPVDARRTPAASSCSATTRTRARSGVLRPVGGARAAAAAARSRSTRRTARRGRTCTRRASEPRAALMLGHGAGGGDRGARPAGGHRRRARARVHASRSSSSPTSSRAAARRRPRTSSTPPGSRSSSTCARRARRAPARHRRPLVGRARRLPHRGGDGRGRRALPRVPGPPAGEAGEDAGSTSSTASRCRCSSIQGEADPFGMPPAAPGREVVVVPGTHSFTPPADRCRRGRARVAGARSR